MGACHLSWPHKSSILDIGPRWGLRFVMSQISDHIPSSLARFASLAQLCGGIAASALEFD